MRRDASDFLVSFLAFMFANLSPDSPNLHPPASSRFPGKRQETRHAIIIKIAANFLRNTHILTTATTTTTTRTTTTTPRTESSCLPVTAFSCLLPFCHKAIPRFGVSCRCLSCCYCCVANVVRRPNKCLYLCLCVCVTRVELHFTRSSSALLCCLMRRAIVCCQRERDVAACVSVYVSAVGAGRERLCMCVCS